jgi:uncharacterized MAPEG superfamily protein
VTGPLWTLVGFAVWTLIVLMAGVGIQRWSQILSGRAVLTDFPADTVHGSAAYRRAMRAHANCVENLPVFAAIVLSGHLAGAHTAVDTTLCQTLLVARVAQSSIHLLATETNTSVGWRFAFFMAQMAIMMALILRLVAAA